MNFPCAFCVYVCVFLSFTCIILVFACEVVKNLIQDGWCLSKDLHSPNMK
jgi:hypothetical protein